MAHGPQESDRCAESPAIFDRELIRADAPVHRAVEIGIARQTKLPSSLDPSAAARIVVAKLGYTQLSAAAAIRVLAVLVAFRALEVGQHRTVVPSCSAELRPLVVIAVLSTDVQESVDRARPAEHPTARPLHVTPGCAFAGPLAQRRQAAVARRARRGVRRRGVLRDLDLPRRPHLPPCTGAGAQGARDSTTDVDARREDRQGSTDAYDR